MKNEYLILYAILDMVAYHFLSNGDAKLDENNDLYFIKNPNTFDKAEKRAYKVLIDILTILNKDLTRDSYTFLKKKYNNILQGFKDSKLFTDGYAPVLVAVSILDAYSKEQCKKRYKIHPKSVEKLLDLIKKDAKIRLLDSFVLNSLKIGEKMYKEMKK